MTTGERIEELAKEKGLSLRKLSTMAGVSYNTVYSAVKRRSDRVDRKIVEKLAKALDVDVRRIISDDQFFSDYMYGQLKRYPAFDVIDVLIHVRLQRMNHEGRLALLNYADELSKKPEYQKDELGKEDK